MMTIKAFEYLEKENIDYLNLFKISGRYWLNENFNKDNFKNDSYTIKRLDNNTVISNFYKLPKRLVLKFHKYLNESTTNDSIFKQNFTTFIDTLKEEEENYKEIKEKIGISGFKSADGEFLNM